MSKLCAGSRTRRLRSAITLKTARDHLPFSLTWWSFTFPVGTTVTGTSELAAHTGSIALAWIAVALFVLLIGAWLIAAANTLRAASPAVCPDRRRRLAQRPVPWIAVRDDHRRIDHVGRGASSSSSS